MSAVDSLDEDEQDAVTTQGEGKSAVVDSVIATVRAKAGPRKAVEDGGFGVDAGVMIELSSRRNNQTIGRFTTLSCDETGAGIGLVFTPNNSAIDPISYTWEELAQFVETGRLAPVN